MRSFNTLFVICIITVLSVFGQEQTMASEVAVPAAVAAAAPADQQFDEVKQPTVSEERKHEEVVRQIEEVALAKSGWMKRVVTPTFLAGTFVTIIMFVVVWIGSCCLYDIRTPDRFATKAMSIHKEY
ncbi:hypothetical protein Pmar_PMAR008168 [Perkinsus marinus ATCC 50983]|uniref:V-type proton ATPase subunit S1/VOA1 transmembrane domain-containing protein n=1 Tax=Perkinsus marinus (strain ATCC 50983 / TXsc) TaxID=423536 RepID=C5LNF3_PERM5|nr:hypothetical protein Pmar_PMAR008168 [Perkinsus marinus ATCC 50983]EER01704.1 hypothetical protein Pmar_PMAR008168 [Perkinsus marinus ATCC 50983]|eukprot:XP_002768986.1 hypothetical protein Pmar_PMAR008168 [Perkinsus marinus ATCC 50983]